MAICYPRTLYIWMRIYSLRYFLPKTKYFFLFYILNDGIICYLKIIQHHSTLHEVQNNIHITVGVAWHKLNIMNNEKF